MLHLIILVIFTLASFCVGFSIFKTTHELIKPLRHLNDRVKEILEQDDENDDVDIKIEESCKEIIELNYMFKDLIQDR